MSKFKIFETDQFASDIEQLPQKHKITLKSKLINYIYKQISDNPYYGQNIKKLKNYKPETWRYRIGNYRLFYEIDENQKIIFILAVENRKDAY